MWGCQLLRSRLLHPLGIFGDLQGVSIPARSWQTGCLPLSEAFFRNNPRNLITRSASCTPFFTFRTRNKQRATSLLKSSSSKSSSCGSLFFLLSGCSKQHRSCTFRSRVCSFRCVAVVLCASLKIWAISVRSEISGPSSGISIWAAEARVLPADLRVVVVVVVVFVVEERAERVERVEEARPGIVLACIGVLLSRCWLWPSRWHRHQFIWWRALFVYG